MGRIGHTGRTYPTQRLNGANVFMSTVISFLSRLVPHYHIGRPDLPIYLTPLCYAPDFQYTDQAYVIFQQLFEASISQHSDNLLADYYYQN
ncbi:unnamed protein product [Oppiella nova]|uniref:Uncharacterized protein n=1 Tax=Oppiella nova TaxID=334625 RepID=A0A7R9QRL0_9ACAR|nr:unnamed protein product [Oppiella nova]CAG2172833.1 unnamed protein product [Oppiella nova]